MDDTRILAHLEETLAEAPEKAANLLDWLADFAQTQACREARKRSGYADGWREIEDALRSAQRVLAGAR